MMIVIAEENTEEDRQVLVGVEEDLNQNLVEVIPNEVILPPKSDYNNKIHPIYHFHFINQSNSI